MVSILNLLRAEWLSSRGQKLARQGQLAESIRAFEQALVLQPNYSGILLQKALSLSKQKRYLEAISDIQRAIIFKPSNSVYHQFLGKVYYDSGEFEKAVNSFDQSLSLDPENVLTLCFKNLVLLAKGERTTDAYDIIKRHIADTNSEFQGRLLVLCESFLHEHGAGARPLEICPIKPGRFVKIAQTGWLGAFFSLLRGAVFSLDHSLVVLSYTVRSALNPQKGRAYLHYVKAQQAWLLGDRDHATAEYQEALACYPELHDAKRELFEMWLSVGEPNMAWKYFEQLPESKELQEVFPSIQSPEGKKCLEECLRAHADTSMIFNIGRFHYQTGNYDTAILCFQFVADSLSQQYLSLYYLGLCYLAKHDTDQAYRSFQEAMQQINPQVAERRLDEMMRSVVRQGDFVDTHGNPV